MNANTDHTVRDCDACQAGAVIEGTLSNTYHAVGDGYARKSATREGRIADARYAVGDGYARKSFAITEGR